MYRINTDAKTVARQALRSQGRQLKWLAEQSGVERTRLSRILDEILPITPDEAQKLAPLIGLPPELIGRGKRPGYRHPGYAGPIHPHWRIQRRERISA